MKTTLNSYFRLGDKALVLRDDPTGLPQPVQIRYLNDVVGLFLKSFSKIYGREELTDEDCAKMRRYLDKIFEAKDAITPREPKGGMYLRTPDR